jgi:CobQ/CobB/MinD/ParA nucleotide binding domain/Anion-transporting ATPase
MDVAAWCGRSRVWVVAGKGGVGKTTITAVLAATAATAGLSVLVIELEGKPGLGATFGRRGPVGYEAVALRGRGPDDPGTLGKPPPGSIWARRLTPDDALLEYLADHGLQRVSRRLVSSGVLDVVATAVPGIRDVLVLGKVKQLERADVADMVVLDAPATGHAMTFLTSASGLLDAARGGPVRQQAADVVELLRDPGRCRVLPVTLPEEMPVSETVESARLLRDRVGIHLGPVVVNCYEEGPAELGVPTEEASREAGLVLDSAAAGVLEAARTFRVTRLRLVEEQVDRLAGELPLPQLRVPRVFAPAIGPAELDRLAAAMARAIDALPAPDDLDE